jgi:hypothetical protein
MNGTIRSIRSTVGKALALWAVALTFPVSTSGTVDHQASGGAEQQRHRILADAQNRHSRQPCRISPWHPPAERW